MSVKYNNKTIAGKYKAQLINSSELVTKTELKTEIDKVNETLGDIDSLLDAINGEVV